MNAPNRPYELAGAAHNSIRQGNPAVLDACIAELNPTAVEVAQAYGVAMIVPPFFGDSRTYMFLKARLDLVLVREHIAAQERVARAQERLSRVLVGLAIATAAVAIVSAWLSYLTLPPKDSSARDRIAWAQWAEDWRKAAVAPSDQSAQAQSTGRPAATQTAPATR